MPTLVCLSDRGFLDHRETWWKDVAWAKEESIMFGVDLDEGVNTQINVSLS